MAPVSGADVAVMERLNPQAGCMPGERISRSVPDEPSTGMSGGIITTEVAASAAVRSGIAVFQMAARVVVGDSDTMGNSPSASAGRVRSAGTGDVTGIGPAAAATLEEMRNVSASLPTALG